VFSALLKGHKHIQHVVMAPAILHMKSHVYNDISGHKALESE
jgi:hypothetical protein